MFAFTTAAAGVPTFVVLLQQAGRNHLSAPRVSAAPALAATAPVLDGLLPAAVEQHGAGKHAWLRRGLHRPRGGLVLEVPVGAGVPSLSRLASSSEDDEEVHADECLRAAC